MGETGAKHIIHKYLSATSRLIGKQSHATRLYARYTADKSLEHRSKRSRLTLHRPMHALIASRVAHL